MILSTAGRMPVYSRQVDRRVNDFVRSFVLEDESAIYATGVGSQCGYRGKLQSIRLDEVEDASALMDDY